MSRAEHHRQGRTALREVLAELGDPRDPFSIAFPQPRLSVSHSAAIAVAVGSRCRENLGLGVDLEFARPFPPSAARFFLDPGELRDLARSDPGTPDLLLELWTAKEAVFKADPGNRTTMLRDYHLAALRPGDPPGHGSATRGEHRFSYRIHRLGALVLAVAHLETAHPPSPAPICHPPVASSWKDLP